MHYLENWFHFYSTEELFNYHKEQELISPSSICFIDETGQIYTNESFFGIDKRDYAELKEFVQDIDSRVRKILGTDVPDCHVGPVSNLKDILKVLDGFQNNENLKEIIKNIEDSIVKQVKDALTYVSENYTLIKDFEKLSDKHDALRKDFDTMLGGDTDRYINSFREIIKFLQEFEDTESLIKIIEGIDSKIDEINDDLGGVHSTLDYLEETKATRDELKEESDIRQQDVNDINDRIDKHLSEYDKHLEEYGEYKDSVEEKFGSVDSSIDHINDEIEGIHSTIEADEKAFEDFKGDTEVELGNIQSSIDNIYEVKATKQELNKFKEETNEELGNIQSSIDSINDELGNIESAIDNLNEVKADKTELQKVAKDLNDFKGSVEQDLGRIDGNIDDLNESKVNVSDFNKYKSDTDTAIGDINNDITQRIDSKLDSLEGGLNQANTDITNLNTNKVNNSTFNTFKDATEKDISNIQSAMDGMGDDAAALKETVDTIKDTTIPDISAKLQTLTNNFNTLVSADPTSAIENFNEVIAFLKGIDDSNDNTLESIIAAIEKQIAEVKETADDCRWDIDNTIADSIKAVNKLLEEHSETITNLGLNKVDNSTFNTYKGEVSETYATKDDLKGVSDKLAGDIVNVKNNSVAKENGKGLSTNDFTNAYKEKLDAIEKITTNELNEILK